MQLSANQEKQISKNQENIGTEREKQKTKKRNLLQTFAHSPSQLMIPRAASNISPKAVKVICQLYTESCHPKIKSTCTHAHMHMRNYF